MIGRGFVLRTLKRYDEALIAFDRAIEVDSISTKELIKAWNSKGLVLRNLKRYEDAFKAFETSIDIEPQNDFSWNGKDLVLLSLQKYTETIEAYNTSLNKNLFKKEPDERELVFSWNGKGVAFANLRQFDKSIEAFNESINLDPKSAFALSGKATIYYSIGNVDLDPKGGTRHSRTNL